MSNKQEDNSKYNKVNSDNDLNEKQSLISKLQKTEAREQEKNKSFIVLEIIEYVPNSVVIKTIIKKTTGNVTVSSFDSGEALTEKTSPFDTFVQVIDGTAEIVIDGQSNLLDTGASIIIPAHASHIIIAKKRFKIISTVIKSGYADMPISY